MRRRFAPLLFALTLPAGLAAQGTIIDPGQVVGPAGPGAVTSVSPSLGDPTPWIVTRQGSAFGEVTTRNPCGLGAPGTPCGDGFGGVGSGSLELRVTGQQVAGEYPDWAFWYLYAGGADGSGQSFGNLRDLTTLSFDWFRYEAANSGWDNPPGTGNQPIPPVDWRWKTPVLRLQLLERRLVDGVTEEVRSELIWEGYYNQARLAEFGAPNGYTPVNRWVTQSAVQQDAFWYLRPAAVGGSSSYSTNAGCIDQSMSFWAGGIASNGLDGLFGSNGCLVGASVDVVGIAIGVGSQWPLPWVGFVDNLRVGFGAGPLAVNTNWDVVTVPEPSSAALLLVGLAALAARRRRRR
jgi:hypothetical protein